MTARISLFHTMDSNIDLYEQASPTPETNNNLNHVVSQDLIQRATAAGTLTDEIFNDARSQMLETVQNSDVVLCTCSTIGPAADQLADEGRRILRTDRALAEDAFSKPGRVGVLVAAPSTVGPTTELFEQAATRFDDVTFDVILVDGAWDHFAAGDMAAYAQSVAGAADNCQGQYDRLALAQASMAPAKVLMQCDIPVFTSPESGMRALMSATRST